MLIFKVEGENFIINIISGIKSLIKKGAIHIFAGNFIIKFVGLCGSIFIVRFLTKEDYGMLGYVENLYNYVAIFAGFGLSLGLLRFAVLADDIAGKRLYFEYVLRRQTIINLCLILVLSVINFFFLDHSVYSNATILLIIYMVSLPLSDITQTCFSLERALLANRRYIFMAIFASSLSVFLRILGAYFYGVQGVVVLKVTADGISAVVILIIVYKINFSNNLVQAKRKLEKNKRKEINWYSFHNMVTNGIWILFMITDIFLIGHLTQNPEILADYKVAYIFPSNMAIITSSIIVFISPYFVKNEKNYIWVKKNYLKGLLINTILMGSLMAVLIIFTKPLILLLYGHKYINIIPLMRLLLVAHFINSSVKSFTASLLSSMGYAKENLIISVVGFSIQVAMGILVIPKFGTIGLAIGSIFNYLFIAIVTVSVFVVKFNFFDLKNRKGKK